MIFDFFVYLLTERRSRCSNWILLLFFFNIISVVDHAWAFFYRFHCCIVCIYVLHLATLFALHESHSRTNPIFTGVSFDFSLNSVPHSFFFGNIQSNSIVSVCMFYSVVSFVESFTKFFFFFSHLVYNCAIGGVRYLFCFLFHSHARNDPFVIFSIISPILIRIGVYQMFSFCLFCILRAPELILSGLCVANKSSWKRAPAAYKLNNGASTVMPQNNLNLNF